MVRLAVFALGLSLLPHSTLRAEETAAKPKPAPSAGAPEKNQKKKPKAKRLREKETEGSEAPDRFEADTVIKSKYELDGRPLEVDPD